MLYLKHRIKETTAAVLPSVILVSLLQIFYHPLNALEMLRFLFCALMLMMGLSFFLTGIEMSIKPMGDLLGRGLVAKGRLGPVLFGGAFLGFIISVAEPSLLILSDNIEGITAGALKKAVLLIVVSLGVGGMIAVAFFRIIKQIKLRDILLGIYALILLFALFCPEDYISIAFDASGATTGSITVPFILALAAGISSVSKSRHHEDDDSYGVLGLASAGAIFTVVLYGALVGKGELQPNGLNPAIPADTGGVFAPFFLKFVETAREALTSLLPVSLIFTIYNLKTKALQGKSLRRAVFGILFSFFGLATFLAAVSSGFMSIGAAVGSAIAGRSNFLLAVTGFFLGLSAILAEPAVHILTENIEESTMGFIPKRQVLIFLAGGVAMAVMTAMIRVFMPGLKLWYILLPVYIPAMILMFYAPDLFIGIAFDSGGVASGPMTATFILAFTQGAALAHPMGDIMKDGFGLIALVAAAPLIMLQILGIIYLKKTKRNTEKEVEE